MAEAGGQRDMSVGEQTGEADDWFEVCRALCADSQWSSRTVDAIAKKTGLNEVRVEHLVQDRYRSEVSEIPGKRGKLTYKLRNEHGWQRRLNHHDLKRLDPPGDPYPARFAISDAVSEVVAIHGKRSGKNLDELRPETVTAGRIVAIRSFGKANFLVLSDGKSRLQAYVRKDSVSHARHFDLLKLLDVGDLIGVKGRIFRTRTDELTVLARELVFLAKCFEPLPEKWHGLTDV
ncbi:MAG: hypothetical protein F4018_18770, partial [Acidobacteria bacterium]|nr:hypothetical protein [Acidobacteriota bacterium]